jgi:beta-xylosidase
VVLGLALALSAAAVAPRVLAAGAPTDFPDPFVLRVGATYFAFSTNSGGANVPVMRSTDLVHWARDGDALPALPRWASGGFTWAPSVLARGALFVLYYVVHDPAGHRQCVSRAVSARPEGPYADTSGGPLVCQGRAGSIDPSPFVDAGGAAFLLWRSEGRPGRLWSQRLANDGLSLVGPAVPLLVADQPWEAQVIEGPTMARVAGRYWLLYSGNRWDTAAYAEGWALCRGPQGPCQAGPAPVLASQGPLAGPGGGELFTDAAGGLRLAYHAWTAGAVGYPHGARSLHLARVTVAGAQPAVGP